PVRRPCHRSGAAQPPTPRAGDARRLPPHPAGDGTTMRGFWILDFGFWIAGKVKGRSPNRRMSLSAQSKIQNPKSKIDPAGPLFALPHLVLFTVFLLLPVLFGFYISLHSWHVLAKAHPLVGLANYRAALADDIFWIALRNTVYFVVLVVPFGNLVSLLLALG